MDGILEIATCIARQGQSGQPFYMVNPHGRARLHLRIEATCQGTEKWMDKRPSPYSWSGSFLATMEVGEEGDGLEGMTRLS